MSTILISVYDGPEDVKKFQKLCEDVGLEKHRFVIRHRYLPPDKDFGITISNRGGLMEKAEHQIKNFENLQKKNVFTQAILFS